MIAVRLLPLLLLLSPAALAQSQGAYLYKCSDAKAAVSIQSAPCPKGSTQVWKRDAAPEPPLTPEQQAEAAARRVREAEAARALSLMAGTTRPPAPPAPPPAPVSAPAPVAAEVALQGPCRRAHELQTAIRDKPWLEMRDDQLRRLSAWVADQCRLVEEAPPPATR